MRMATCSRSLMADIVCCLRRASKLEVDFELGLPRLNYVRVGAPSVCWPPEA